MTKPYEEHSGNGLHIHVSLQDDSGGNVFANADGDDSKILHHAIADFIEMMPEPVGFRSTQPTPLLDLNYYGLEKGKPAASRI